MFPKLYGKGKKGELKVWWVTVEGDVLTTHHGKLDGKIQHKPSPPSIGKQKRTNEEQAVFEAKAKHKKKVDDSYAESVEAIPESRKPPKAEKFYEFEDRWKPGDLASIKYNGLNVSTYRFTDKMDKSVKFQSRGDDDYPTLQCIEDELNRRFFDKYPTATLIAESYAHGHWLEEITSWTKKIYPESRKIRHMIFNVCFPEFPDMGYKDRMALLKETMGEDGDYAQATVVEQHVMNTREEYDAFHVAAVAAGFEGTCSHNPHHPFVFKVRSVDILKRKEDIDFEFQAIDVVEDKNGNAVIVCLLPDEPRPNALSTSISGANHANRKLAEDYYAEKKDWSKAKVQHGVFKVCKKGDEATTGMKAHEERKQMLEQPETVVGHWFNVHFETWSKKGVPLKPVAHYIRKCDQNGVPQE